MISPANEKRVLAIDTNHRGFGYAILEGPEDLVDWGTDTCRGIRTAPRLREPGELISHYRPQILVLEDVGARHCRRRSRVRELIDALDRYGRERGLTVRN